MINLCFRYMGRAKWILYGTLPRFKAGTVEGITERLFIRCVRSNERQMFLVKPTQESRINGPCIFWRKYGTTDERIGKPRGCLDVPIITIRSSRVPIAFLHADAVSRSFHFIALAPSIDLR